MKKTVRIITLVLVLCMAATMMLACNGNKTPENTTPQNTTPPAGGDQLPAEALEYMPEIKDLGNYEYRMYLGMMEDDERIQYFTSADGLSGDAISQALYERNTFIEETFNCIIAPVLSVRTSEGARDCYAIQPYLDANEDLWDVIIIAAGDIMQKNIQRGDVIDVLQMPNLNLEASYWDQAIQKDYSVNGHVFALQGDYTIQDELSTSCVFYNGELWDKWSYYDTYGTPYEVVEANEWTYDMMLTMLKDTSEKTDGTNFTENDVYGMFASTASIHTLFLGSGLKTLTVENGETVITMKDNTTFNNIFDVLNKVIKNTYVENEEILIAGTPRAEAILTTKDNLTELFFADQAMFMMSEINEATALRDMPSVFGILPVPQYYENQTEYYCWCPNGHMPLTVPKTVVTHEHVEEVSTLMEVIAFYSRYTTNGSLSLYDAFYEKMTVSKVCRTAEDYKMMELIYYSKAYDLDCAAAFSRVYHLSHYMQLEDTLFYGPGATGSSGLYHLKPTYTTLRSNLESLRQKFGETIEVYLDDMENNLVVVE